MKALKLLALALLIPAFVGCDDDKDLPNVKFTIEVGDNTPQVDNTIYVVQGEALNIESLTVTNNEAGKNAAITTVSYYWDGQIVGETGLPPFAFTFQTSDQTRLGDHSIQILCGVVAEGKAIGQAALEYNVKVVASADEIPSTPAEE